MNINLNNVPENQVAVSKTVKPGVGLFTIIGSELKTNANNNNYFRFTFENKAGQKFFSDFYINNDKGLGRVRELAVSGQVDMSETDADTLATRFIGKEVGLIVDGEKEFATIEDKQVIVTRPRLRFAKFSFNPTMLAEMASIEVKIDESKIKVAEMANEATPENPKNDLPF